MSQIQTSNMHRPIRLHAGTHIPHQVSTGNPLSCRHLECHSMRQQLRPHIPCANSLLAPAIKLLRCATLMQLARSIA